MRNDRFGGQNNERNDFFILFKNEIKLIIDFFLYRGVQKHAILNRS